jgi:hypothetical protein
MQDVSWFGETPTIRRCTVCKWEQSIPCKHEWFRCGPGHRVCTVCGHEDKYPSPNKVDVPLMRGGMMRGGTLTVTADDIARWMVDGNLAEAVEKAVRELKIARGKRG